MKRLSLQWRITLMSVLLIGITCVAMNLLLCSSGVYYMDTIADSLQGGGTVILNDGGAASFDPQLIAPGEDLTIIVDGVQGRFRTTNWYITAAITLLSGILAYFVSGRALKPLRSFTSQVERVQLNNLADMRIDEDAISEFRQLSRSFNQMLERLNNAFSAQRQFTGNAAHELRTPLALMQAQLELFSAEHPDVRPETAEFLTLLREQTERLIQMTRTLLEICLLYTSCQFRHPGGAGQAVYMEIQHPAVGDCAERTVLPTVLQVALPAGRVLRAVQPGVPLPDEGG